MIPAETDTGATMRLAQIEKERREQREAEKRQRIRVENTATTEVQKVLAMLEGLGKPQRGRKCGAGYVISESEDCNHRTEASKKQGTAFCNGQP